MKRPNRWQRFRSSRLFPLLALVVFVLIMGGGIYWWYKYRWNIPLLKPPTSTPAVEQASLATIIVTASSPQMVATSDYAAGVDLTIELRDKNGTKVKAEESRIVTLTSDIATSSFESDNLVVIKEGDYDATTRYKSTRAGVSTITATTSGLRPATTQILTIAGAPSGLSAVSMRGSADVHELKSQTEYSFEANAVDSFGNVVVQPATISWRVSSDPMDYQIKTNSSGKSIFNYVFSGGSQHTETIRASLGSSHQDYPVTVSP